MHLIVASNQFVMYTSRMTESKEIQDASEKNEPKFPNCPYLGLQEDPSTWLSFPNSANYCHKFKPPRPIESAHQRQFCLTKAYPVCKIYAQRSQSPLPSIASVETRQEKSPMRFFWSALIVIFIVTILITLSYWIRNNWDGLKQNPGAQQVADPDLVNLTITQTPTRISTSMPTSEVPLAFSLLNSVATQTLALENVLTPSPTISASPTPPATSTLIIPTSGPALYTRFGPNNEYLLHKVNKGESLGNLAALYRTSSEVIKAANLLIEGASVWPDTVLVIYPDITDPSIVSKHRVIQLQAPMYPEELAIQHQVLLKTLIECNQLNPQILIPAGRWLLIPIPTEQN